MFICNLLQHFFVEVISVAEFNLYFIKSQSQEISAQRGHIINFSMDEETDGFTNPNATEDDYYMFLNIARDVRNMPFHRICSELSQQSGVTS